MRRNVFYLPPQIPAATQHNAWKWGMTANVGRIFTVHSALRRAYFCGEVMVQSNRRWAGSTCLIKWAPGEGSETPDCRRDHLIHRKRSPFPYEGKALTRLKL